MLDAMLYAVRLCTTVAAMCAIAAKFGVLAAVTTPLLQTTAHNATQCNNQ
jgi:hypothetical protein